MKFALGYITARPEPRIDWLIDSLTHQANYHDEITLIIVDALGRSAEDCGWHPHPMFANVIATEPHPNPWQGKHKLVAGQWWALSCARNTALVACPPELDYIAIVDDRCRLGPKWLDVVREGFEKRESVIAGAYEKHEDGKISVDSRLALAPQGKINCGGGWLYGCTFAMPIEWALEINGFEEGCDGLSMEDVIFGLMLGNNGRRIDYRPDMFVSQWRGAAQANQYKRTDKGVSPKDKSHATLDRFGTRKRTEFTPDLRALRHELHTTGRASWPLPDPDMRDWYDDQLIREMV